MSLSDKLISDATKKLIATENNIEHFKEQILLIDAEKEIYDNAAKTIDLDLVKRIDKVNQTLYDVESAYQERIDSECYTDLFWRVTNFTPESPFPPIPASYTLVVDQLSLGGYGSSVTYVSSTGGITTYTENAKFGFEGDNLHGLVYKDSPYMKDIGDSTVLSFVGKIDFASKVLVVVEPNVTNGSGISSSVSVGNLVISSKKGIFALERNIVVGLGTTVLNSDLIESLTGITTTSIVATTILLQDFSIGTASLPESDGSLVEFTIVYSPTDFQARKKRFQYSIPFTSNPFSPETIGVVNGSNAGRGFSVRYDNSGDPSSTTSWKPEYAGIVQEPSVGAGKVYYRTGFNKRPVISGNPASKGDTITVSSLTGLYGNTPSCSSDINSKINSTIAVRDATESEFLNQSGTIQSLVDASNYLRQERSNYSLRIWTLRQSIGGENERADTYETLQNVLGISTVTSLIG